MTRPLFSIIVTCHNYEQYVGNCIQSVLNQVYTNYEIIVVNACSTDNSQTVINSFDGVKKAFAPKGSHALACLNGFQKCKGKWILFLDADDFLFDFALLKIKKELSPNFSKFQFNLKICDEKGIYGNRSMVTYPKCYNADRIREDFEKTGTYIWPVTSGNVYSATFLKRVFPLKAFLPLDGQLNTMAPAFGLVGHINYSLGCYRLHGKNMDNRSLQPWDSKRFQYNLKRRFKEFYYARNKVRSFKKRFPLKYSINYEIPFISYRIFLQKLDVPYFMNHKDTIPFLLYLLANAFLRNSYPFWYFLKTFVWFSLFLLAPKAISVFLLKKRFSQN